MEQIKSSNPNVLKFAAQSPRISAQSSRLLNPRGISESRSVFQPEIIMPSIEMEKAKKTEVIADQEEANKLFGLEEIKEQRGMIATQIQIIEPHKDLTQSALIVVFLVSHFEFFETLFEVTRNNEIAIVSISKCINILSCVLHEPTKFPRTIYDDIEYFFGNMQLLGISMSQVTKIKSVQALQKDIEGKLAKEEIENMIYQIDYPKLQLPQTIDALSPIMQTLPEGFKPIYRQYKLIWALCLRNNVIYPAIIEEDGEVVALYKSELFTRFGSLQSLILSGSTLLYVCYSGSPTTRPVLIPSD